MRDCHQVTTLRKDVRCRSVIRIAVGVNYELRQLLAALFIVLHFRAPTAAEATYFVKTGWVSHIYKQLSNF